ncbi:hypothetical protein [Ancylobacter defluvii]|uniref:Uncharacterized protein n=1 Tax=Ancylobacter defluvii TaxID=1282440 RepID=A0A9W6JZS7_9HYPH|nr:hypothetical protein [Ancylobacter defluvii]MBS7589735.1 hypothetical protein [Ancylobacter defluvii]GLK85364.1 hypothetical protein GCM10017653_34340 [Ancylobacter defluvii]
MPNPTVPADATALPAGEQPPAMSNPKLFSRESFDLARAAWDRNRLPYNDPSVPAEESRRADAEKFELAFAVVTAAAPTIDCIGDKLRVVMEYARSSEGVVPTEFERIAMIGLHMMMIDLAAIER